MDILITILIGALFAAGVFCLLRRSMMKLIIGIMLMSQAANLLVFSASGLTSNRPPFALASTEMPPVGYADPLPQALVLTAIVIGFGLVIFAISLLLRAYRAVQSDDVNAFNQTDRIS